MGSYTDPALILPGAVGNTELADEAVTNAKVAAAAAIMASKLVLPSNLAIIGIGTYTGDGTTNRAIPHGLGTIPKFVFLATTNGNITCQLVPEPEIHYQAGGGNIGFLSVSIFDSTNFYIGNPSNYSYSGNHLGGGWRWMAIA